jgi:hypothetical protein
MQQANAPHQRFLSLAAEIEISKFVAEVTALLKPSDIDVC